MSSGNKCASTRVNLAIASVALGLVASAAQADFSYNFDGLTGSPNPGTALIGTPAVGAVGQDSWILTSGPTATPYVRNDPLFGFSGNYLRSTVADYSAVPTVTQDTIVSRWNGSSLGLNQQYMTMQADILVGVGAGAPTSTGAQIYRRSEFAIGIDNTGDGKVRPTAATNESAEWGITIGYEAAGTGSGWYVRPPNLGSAVTVAAPTVTGVWRVQLVADLTANANNGSGTLYIKQIATEDGMPVDDVFRVAGAAATNFNLGIQRMATPANGGSPGAAVPANWDGMLTRLAGNGGIDNISFVAGLPVGGSVWSTDAGSWLNAGNWYVSTPNAIDAVANFTSGARIDSTVYADGPVTVGTLNVGNSHTYNIAGTGSLTLQTSTGGAAVNIATGSQKINIPLIIASNTTITAAAGTTLRISDPVTVNAGKSITPAGTGTILYESTINVLSGGNIAFGNATHAASLALASTASASITNVATRQVVELDALSLASGSSFDLHKNEILTGLSVTNARAAILDGRLTSTEVTAVNGRALGYGTNAAGKTRVLYTLKGDATLDQIVNFDDLVPLAQSYNGTGKLWKDGDFTNDGTVNFDDLVPLAQNYNGSIAASGLEAAGFSASFAADFALARALVPEPTTLALLGLPLAMVARRRKA